MMSDSDRSSKIAKLDGTNFQSWKFNMKCLLMSKGLWRYVDESSLIVKPEVLIASDTVSADAVAKSREKVNEYNLKADQAYSLIALNVAPELQIHVSTQATASEAWENLTNQFQFVSVTQIVRLTRRFYAAKMGEKDDLMKHITEMTSLAEQLKEMKDEISSKKFATAILGSLPDSYDNFLTSLNARDADTLDWNSIQGVLMEEHEKRKEKDTTRSNDEALFANPRGGRGGQNRRGGFAGGRGGFRGAYRGVGSRGRGGNTRSGGAPQQQNPRVHPYQTFQGQCYNCNEYGHRASNCTQNAEEEDEAAIASTDSFIEDDMALICDDESEGSLDDNDYLGQEDEDEITFSYDDYDEFEVDAGENDLDGNCENEIEEESALVCDENVDEKVDAIHDDDKCNDNHNEIVEESSALACDESNHEQSLVTFQSKNVDSRSQEWCIDSGATKHMTFNITVLSQVKHYDDPKPIYLGDNSTVMAHGEGKLRLRSYNEKRLCLTLKTVLFVPRLAKNLLSVRAMTRIGAEVRFIGEKCFVLKGGKTAEIGRSVNGGLYKLNTPVEEIPSNEQLKYDNACIASDKLSLWHQRYGHLNINDLSLLSRNNVVVGIDSVKKDSNFQCEPCALGKMHRLPFPKRSLSRAKLIYETIHSDLCGPLQIDSVGGSRYILTFTDDYSRYTFVYFLQRKSEVLSYFKKFVNLVENNRQKIKELNVINSIRSDNGGEYTSKDFDVFCTEKGISRQFTNPDCPEQNGVSERLNRTIIEGARSILYNAKLPLGFWAEAVSTVVYLRNRSPASSLNGRTPFELFNNRIPDVSNLRVFGSICYVHIPDGLRKKLDPKSFKAIFVGYPSETKGYKVYNIESGKFTRCRNVIFHENKFHNFENQEEEITEMIVPDDLASNNVNKEDNVINVDENTADEHSNTDMNIPAPVNDSIDEDEAEQPVIDEPPFTDQPPETTTAQVNNDNDNVRNNSVFPTYEETFMTQVQQLGERRTRKPRERLVENAYIGHEECNIVESLLSKPSEPKSVHEALNGSASAQWKDALQSEINSLNENDTWKLVPRPNNVNIVGNRWVFKVKCKSDGSIDRHKARLVAQGFTQTQGIDYDEVFSPVVRMAAIRSLLALANAHDLEVHQMDVHTAFLNGELDFDVFMEQPDGFIDEKHPDYVCKLNRSIYGLKQSARCWYLTLDAWLKENGFRQTGADGCIYVKTEKAADGRVNFVIYPVFVDDFTPVSNNVAMLKREKAALCKRFKMEDMGDIREVLGLKVTRDRVNKVLSISQPEFFRNILVRFGMQNCKPVATPLEAGSRFQKLEEGEEACDKQRYQQAIGCLTYAAMSTRPDIAAAVNNLSQYMSCPSEQHWTGVKRILRYIQGTVNYGLQYSGRNGAELYGYSDSDWAGDLNTRRSTSGYVFRIGDATINWCSKRQQTVARSSTEAEYVALSAAAQEGIWLRRLLHDVGYGSSTPTTIYEDNNGAIDLSKNPKFHNRTKHIDIAFHFTRERVTSNELAVTYCPTEEMVADTLTKGLGKIQFQKFRDMLGVYECA